MGDNAQQRYVLESNILWFITLGDEQLVWIDEETQKKIFVVIMMGCPVRLLDEWKLKSVEETQKSLKLGQVIKWMAISNNRLVENKLKMRD